MRTFVELRLEGLAGAAVQRAKLHHPRARRAGDGLREVGAVQLHRTDVIVRVVALQPGSVSLSGGVRIVPRQRVHINQPRSVPVAAVPARGQPGPGGWKSASPAARRRAGTPRASIPSPARLRRQRRRPGAAAATAVRCPCRRGAGLAAGRGRRAIMTVVRL